ncbi:ead/Ea22-like family protein [Escherichia coli]
MTNNDEIALKLKAAAEIIGSEKWHTEGSNVWSDEYEVNGEYSSDLIACCENVNNESVHADFIAIASPANILALLAERDADKKRIADLEKKEIFLKERLAQLANFNPDWDMLEAATDSLREHAAELTSANQRIAELETVCAESYQVVGALADAAGVFETSEAVSKALDNLSDAKLTHDDVLPFVVEARTVSVKLPEPLMPAQHNSGELFMTPDNVEQGGYLNRDDVLRELRKAGIKLEVVE